MLLAPWLLWWCRLPFCVSLMAPSSQVQSSSLTTTSRFLLHHSSPPVRNPAISGKLSCIFPSLTSSPSHFPPCQVELNGQLQDPSLAPLLFITPAWQNHTSACRRPDKALHKISKPWRQPSGNVILYDKRDFADKIQWKLLRREDHSVCMNEPWMQVLVFLSS